ncbi:MAG: hypothetical protein RMJ87_10360 [Cytophagales bacterium]|nr:hypothetical protein [Bernardetiaceae bacterium]MDW8205422.1 hypothetical protein [Cytophagales bacterium]
MKINKSYLWLWVAAFVLVLAVGGCKVHPHGAPPGQVKKVTGVHPVTGKPAAPGQQKKQKN